MARMQRFFMNRRGFTLIELIVTITILLLLIGLSLPAISGALNRSRKTEAMTLITSLESALTAYQTEYGKWPEALSPYVNQNGDFTIDADHPGSWGELYRSLSGYFSGEGYLAQNGTLNNTRCLVFFVPSFSALSSQTTPPFSADTVSPPAVKTLIDPWRRPYALVLDANGDQKIRVPDTSNSSASPPLVSIEIQRTIGIWSTGPDPNRLSKFVTSWQ